jgi:DNA ligase-associated metallophosphoesterase
MNHRGGRHCERTGALLIELAGLSAALRPSGALWLAELGVLAVGDLHLEKGSAYAARGQLLPPFDTADTLGRLEAEVEALSPRVLVLLGDSFHDRRSLSRLSKADARRIASLGQGRSLIWIVGNHDEEGLQAAFGTGGGVLPGDLAAELSFGALTLRHEPSGGAPSEVCGHLHPCAKVVRAGRSVRRRAFVTDGLRLILPAFGAYAGGLNVRDAAFDGLFTHTPLVGALGDRRVYALAFGALSGD